MKETTLPTIALITCALIIITLIITDPMGDVTTIDEPSLHQQAMVECMGDVPSTDAYEYCLTTWEQYIPH